MNYTQLKRRKDREAKAYDKLCDELNATAARKAELEAECSAQYSRYTEARDVLDTFRALSKRIRSKT